MKKSRAISSCAMALTLAFCGAAFAETVKIGIPSKISLTFAPIIAAEELGYFEKEGLDIEIIEFQGSSVLLPQIANKSVTFGFANADPVILSRDTGRDPLPVRFVYNAARESIWEFAVPANSEIKTLADLKGKTIGVGALTNGNVPIIRSMLSELGFVEGTDYFLMAIGDGPIAYRATLNGDVDVYNGNDVFVAQFSNVADIRRLPVPEKYRSLFANGFVTHADNVVENRKTIEGFGRAVSKGMVACEKDIEYCVKNFWEKHPELRPTATPSQTDIDNAKTVLAARLSKYLYFADDTDRNFGEYDPASWESFVELLHDGDQLTSKEIDLSSLYTNELVPAYNDFSADDIRIGVDN